MKEEGCRQRIIKAVHVVAFPTFPLQAISALQMAFHC